MGRHAAEPTGEMPILDGPQRIYFRPPVPTTGEQPTIEVDYPEEDDEPTGRAPLTRGWAWTVALTEGLLLAVGMWWLGWAPHPVNLWAITMMAPVALIELAVWLATGGWPSRPE